MARRLSKKSRAQKLTGTLAANMPKLGSRELGLPFARSVTRKKNLRGSLLVGTALSAGILASMAVGTTLISVQPAMACTSVAGTPPYTTAESCGPGNYGTGLIASALTSSVLLTTVGTTNIGPIPVSGDGIEGIVAASGVTEGQTTSAGTTIGATYKTVGGDGLVLTSTGFTDITFNINNAATIGVGGNAIDATIVDVFTASPSSDTINITTTGTNAIAAGKDGIHADIIFVNPGSTGISNAITITNAQPIGSAVTSVGGDGIHAFNLGVGGNITATNTVSNTGAIFSVGDSIHSGAIAISTDAGTAKASSTISNSGPLDAAHGIVGFSGAIASVFGALANYTAGTADAYTHLVNSGNITSDGRVIIGDAFALADAHVFIGNATGGTASASVVISNTAPSSVSEFGRGIYGNSFAKANGGAWFGSGHGGNATAATTVTNGNGTVTSAGNTIVGYATAIARGFGGGFLAPGPYNGTGGNATATVSISNGGVLYSTWGRGIDGRSYADANGKIWDFTLEPGVATAGNATATTSISNSGNITSAGRVIAGYAEAKADAHAFFGTADGGNATATVVISNTAADSVSTWGRGIFGDSYAKAKGTAWYGNGTGGNATAMTTVSNGNGTVSSAGNTLVGYADANAKGFGGSGNSSWVTSGAGGNATAGATISNAGALTSSFGRGIYGWSYADAHGNGFFWNGTGGNATATTSISNSGAINSYFSGIVGNATSVAWGEGDASGIGGHATATVTITNAAGGNITVGSTFGGHGIKGYSSAAAGGYASDGNSTFVGAGGTATANTSISNAAAIVSTNTGIAGGAQALAEGFGWTGTGGTAIAGVTISNTGNISSANHEGIFGTSFADADAGFFGEPNFVAIGGNATATTTISNSGPLASYFAGIKGEATALAGAFAFDNATGGNATASVTITNAAGGNITVGSTFGGHGIEGYSFAAASGFGGFGNSTYFGKGGTADATTSISNAAPIVSTNTGIAGGAQALAEGFGWTGTGGNAMATVSIANGGNISSANHEGIFGTSFADADAGFFGEPNFVAIGGNATATTTLSNSGVLKPEFAGIKGEATALAGGFGTDNGTGGNATASVMITNAAAGTITVGSSFGGHGIEGSSFAAASGFGGYGNGNSSFFGTGGNAQATTSISNAGAITSADTGIAGNATALADGLTGFTAMGGTATATVTINNAATGTITSKAYGISGFSSASADAGFFGDIFVAPLVYTALGGKAGATTSIYNAGVIKSTDDGIFGGAFETASAFGNFTAPGTIVTGGPGGSGTGGTAPANVLITNVNSITSSSGDAIKGSATGIADGFGFTAKGGSATANTSISNSGTLSAKFDGIYGGAAAFADAIGASGKGGKATGGTASATVTITNIGNISSSDGDGIRGRSIASATAGFVPPFLYFPAYTALGGTATAETTISNSGLIEKSFHTGIYGGALAFANAFGNTTAKGGSGTGGTASATVLIWNGSAGSIYNVHGHSIQGSSLAQASGYGFTAMGGNATASTSIYNDATLLSVNGTAIQGEATADAKGKAPVDTAGTKGTGGTASATVTITNAAAGSITAGVGKANEWWASGIVGSSDANAVGVGYTGKGGVATALTTISNQATVWSNYANGIVGDAKANASGIGDKSSLKGVGTGGNATATVSITNSGNIYSHTWIHDGIDGDSEAKAVGVGWTATGGTATALTTISNSGTITGDVGGDPAKGDAGIFGKAIAKAGGYGNATGIEPSMGTGGTATATVIITNAAGGGLYTVVGDGIDGFSLARADGVGWKAVGGNATALTSISNAAPIFSDGEGISGVAVAAASAHGNYASPGSAKAGTASATVSITNGGNIHSYDSGGISGFAGAFANGHGLKGTGGMANATTNISNTGNIYSWWIGISGTTLAEAEGSGIKGVGGNATATVTINNSTGNIFTYGSGGTGIGGYTTANASSTGNRGVGGNATAITMISNGGNITTYSWFAPGIVGDATANAEGGPSGAGGNATATVSIVNSAHIKTYGWQSQGIFASSDANADMDKSAGTAGTALATTTVTNAGTIITVGNSSAGIAAYSEAEAFGLTRGTGSATAMTGVTNAGSINTYGTGWGDSSFFGTNSPGIIAASFAGSSGNASASTTVVNSLGSTIVTGFTGWDDSPGILAYSSAQTGSSASTASATTIVNNAGTIITWSDNSPGIWAGANAEGFGFGGANASTTVTNTDVIKTYGSDSFGIEAGAQATADATAKTTVSNTGAIATFGSGSFGIGASSFAAGGSGAPAAATTTVNNSGVVATLGYDANGIAAKAEAVASSGNATATVGVTNATSTSLVSTYGNFSRGIAAYAYSTSPRTSLATITISNVGTVLTAGFESDAVYAKVFAEESGTATGNVTITNALSGNIFTTGSKSDGIHVIDESDPANVSINNAGNITTTGWGSNGIQVSMFATIGNVTINNTGVIETFGPHADAIDVSATVISGNIAITNAAGAIISAYDWRYHAIVATGAPVTINNAGTIYGNVELGVFKNTFTNSGTWLMAGNSYFGGNVSTAVSNTGTVSFVVPGGFEFSPDVATRRTGFDVIWLNGLETFNNSGTVSLLDPPGFKTYNRIVIGNYAGKQVYFNGTGNSTLQVAAFLGGPGSAADVLQIGLKAGQGFAMGTTAVVVTNTDPGFGVYNPVGIPVAESGGAPNVTPKGATANVAGNFTMAPIVRGLFQYDLFYLPQNVAAGNPCQAGFNCWFLASTPSTAALELPALETAAQNIWRDASGTWLDRTADLRDYYFFAQQPVVTKEGPAVIPVGAGPGAWVRAFGDWASSNGTANFTAFGTTLSSSVSYNQSTGGAQIGADFAALRSGYSTLLVGMLGGVVDSNLNFASGTHASFQGGNGGVYATWLNQNFFADALFLANDMQLNLTGGGLVATGQGIAGSSNVLQLGGHLDTGYRFNFDRWFIEPEATIEYVHTQFGDLALPGANVDLNNDAVLGRLGGRIGTWWNYGGYIVEPSLTGGIWQDFTGSNIAKLTSDGFTLNLADPNQPKTQGEIGAMLNIVQMARGWSAFVKGDFYFANGYNEGTVNGGVRYQW